MNFYVLLFYENNFMDIIHVVGTYTGFLFRNLQNNYCPTNSVLCILIIIKMKHFKVKIKEKLETKITLAFKFFPQIRIYEEYCGSDISNVTSSVKNVKTRHYHL
jgi:hypothetical protein